MPVHRDHVLSAEKQLVKALEEPAEAFPGEVAQPDALGQLEDAVVAEPHLALRVSRSVALVALQQQVARVEDASRSQDALDLTHQRGQIGVRRNAGEHGEQEHRVEALRPKRELVALGDAQVELWIIPLAARDHGVRLIDSDGALPTGRDELCRDTPVTAPDVEHLRVAIDVRAEAVSPERMRERLGVGDRIPVLAGARASSDAFHPATIHTDRGFERRICARMGFDGSVLGIALGAAFSAGDVVEYARDVRPILEARCVECHGAERPKVGLRLDSSAAVLAGSRLGTRAVVVPGEPDRSELLRRLESDDPEQRMPAGADPLSAAEIDIVRRWIAQGALAGDDSTGELAQHWAYVAPRRPALPDDPFEDWAREPLDRFVARSMAAAGLEPSPEADRATLLRRASLDLTGLPPTPDELDAFLADPSPDAFERQVDRLFASPHYAEEQARRWLDLARYADSNGYEADGARTMWRYRDWVIDAYDRDLPLDEFTRLQLAGDLDPRASLEDRVATGFHRNTMVNLEGGVDREEFRVAAVKDRVETTARVWLGSTLQCAQCHDHKFDPFTQEDYYRLFAFFNHTEDDGTSNEPQIEAPRADQAQRFAAWRGELARLEDRLRDPGSEVDEEERRWREVWSADGKGWTIWKPTVVRSRAGASLAVLNDDSVLSYGALPSGDTYEIELAWPDESQELTVVRTLRLEVLTDPTLPGRGPGRPSHRNFVLGDIEAVWVDERGEERELEFSEALADFEQAAAGGEALWPASATVDDDPQSGWAIAGGEGEAHQLLLELSEPLTLEAAQREAGRLRLRLTQEYGGGHLIGHLRLAASASRPPDARPVPSPWVVRRLAEAQQSGAAGDAMSPVTMWFRARAPSLAPVRERVALLESELVVPTALVLRERDEDRPTHILNKGSFLDPGAAVKPGVPAVLPALASAESSRGRPTRSDLARWLTSPANPLTARVFANRAWEQLFGRGLVATSDDFGTQGDAPTHPELLDWLAVELRDGGWSTKRLLRDLVLSATYRQSSVVRPSDLALDPENRWFARVPRLRFEAETLRDLALAASGLLCPQVGGPSVYPPQPEGTWMVVYSADRWATDEDCDRYRRGLYTFWRRTSPYPTFMLFDATSRELACTRRARTNTPLQALALLNDPAFVELSRALATRMMREAPADPAAKARFGFRLCVARQPDATELKLLLDLFESERLAFAGDTERAGALFDPSVADEGLDPIELAAWTVVANALLNLDETVTRG